MNGIEILNQTEIMTCPYWACVSMVIGAVLFIIGMIGCALIKNKKASIVCSIILGIICCALTLIGGIAMECKDVPTGKYVYQVKIDETVSFVDFYEKYEVIEQHGTIWFIQDK